MSEFPLGYERIAPTTWVYLSSLLMLGLFLKFNRVWSVRNVDLFLLILLAPGLLMVHHGEHQYSDAFREYQAEVAGHEDAAEVALPTAGLALQRSGYAWMFVVGAVLLLRMLVDSTMVRRPLLEPNLSIGGLIFIGCSLFVFLMANVITSQPTPAELEGARRSQQLVGQVADEGTVDEDKALTHYGPGNAWLHYVPTLTVMASGNADEETGRTNIARVMAILSHLAIVVGIVLIGYWHFDDLKMGVGVATLYLMLPYTAQMTGRHDHVIPAALLVWAIVCYRRPLLAGIFIGLACGVIYYPLFLLPLWISFYWRRGLMRFSSGVVFMLVAMALSFALHPDNAYWNNLRQMFGLWLPRQEGLQGIWGLGWDPIYRLPVLAGFIALSIAFAFWPAQKNLGTLLSCSAAVMVATQFWHGFNGGLYVAWYLPLALLTIFRPNLEDRVALAVLDESRFSWRRGQSIKEPKAA